MIVVAIIGILAAIAIPAYQDYTVRSKVTEGINLASAAETTVAEGFESNGIAGVTAAAAAWTFTPTKYVTGITIASGGAAAPGLITVTFGSGSTGISQLTAGADTITFEPSVGGAILMDGAPGNVDWACGSTTQLTAASSNPALPASPGTLPAKYAPTQCK